MRKLMAAVAAALVAGLGFADTMYWWYANDGKTNWQPFGEVNSWCVGSTKDSSTHGQKIPTASDDLHYGTEYTSYQNFDLGGGDYTLNSVIGGDDTYGDHHLTVTNGSLTFTGNVTNTGWNVVVEDSSKFVLSATSCGRLGRDGYANPWSVKNGGELDIYGEITLQTPHFTVEEGGTFIFQPTIVYANNRFAESNAGGAWIKNSGTLNMPKGFLFTKSSNSGHFRIHQIAGTMNLGGDISHTNSAAYVDFYLSGGTLNVTDNAAIRAIDPNYTQRIYAYLTNDVTATVNVAAGKTLDFTRLICGERTTLIKNGTGAITFGSSKPTTLKIAKDASWTAAAGMALGDMVYLEAGSTLILGGAGISATSLTGLDGATVTLDSSVAGGSTVFTSTDANLVAAVAAKLNASSSALGAFTVVDDGIVFEKKHDSAIFAWPIAHEGSVDYKGTKGGWRGGTYTWYKFMDAANWQIGVSYAANSENLIPGADDDLFISDSYQPIFAMDMGGQHRKFRHLYRNLQSDGKYKNQPGFRQFNITNGTLECTGSFTNVRAEVVTKATGKFIFAETSSSRLGHDGADDRLIAEGGSEIDVYGAVEMHAISVEADANGTIDFSPKSLGYYSFGTGRVWNFTNNGTMKFGKGFVHTNTGGQYGTINFYQNAGTMILGGDFKKVGSSNIKDYFYLNGGTLRATNDMTVSGFTSLTMAENATATIEVDAGKTLDLSELVFAAGTILNKTGEGLLVLGASRPDALNVQAGCIKFSTSVDLGSTLTLASGATLVLSAGTTVSASAITGIDAANVTCDRTAGSGFLFKSSDTTLLTTVLGKLQATATEGDNFSAANGSIVFDVAHAASVFSWKNSVVSATEKANAGYGQYYSEEVKGMVYNHWYDEPEKIAKLPHTPFVDPASWAVGIDYKGTNPDKLIPAAADSVYIVNYYDPLFRMDLEGQYRQIYDYDKTDYTDKWGYNGFSITNGTLEFTHSFISTRSIIYAQKGGKMVFGSNSTSSFGKQSAQCWAYAFDGGEITYQGTVSFVAMLMKISAGGKVTIDPTDAKIDTPTANYLDNYIDNFGTLSLPHGLTLYGEGRTEKIFNIYNRAGATLELGGNLTRATTKGTFNFTLEGGTLNVTDNAKITGFAATTMADDASVSVNVAAGKTLDLSEMTFGSNTTVTNTGTGRIRFGASRPTTYVNPNAKPMAIILK